MERNIKTFICYSHNSEDQKRLVLGLAKQLRAQGVDCNLDQYEESPEEGWILWMEKEIKQSSYVLVICTQGYFEKFSHKEEGVGKGVKWEGAIITQEIYEEEGKNIRFIPVLLKKEDKIYIPRVLRGYTYYNVLDKDGYERLYRRITRQPAIKKPSLGKIRKLPPEVSADSPLNISRAKGLRRSEESITQRIDGNGNIQIGVVSGDVKFTSTKRQVINFLPPPGSIGANSLMKQAIIDRFNKLGEEREKRFGKKAYEVMYRNFKREFGISKNQKWTVIWGWPEAAADQITSYLDIKYANTIAGRIEKASARGGLIVTKGQLFKREKELLAQLDLEISSPEVRSALEKFFGVNSHTKLDKITHWLWVVYLEKLVKERIGE